MKRKINISVRQICNLLIICVLCAACSSTQYYESVWHGKEAKVPAAIFQQENALTLAVSNDTTSVYIILSSTSSETIKKIEQLGLSVWLSEGTSPRQTFGIHYPLPYEDTKEKVALEGFAQASSVAVPLKEIDPIQLSTTILPEDFTYKLQIPFSQLDFTENTRFTVYICSFTAGKEEYLSGLTAAEAIERRLDTYKASPQNSYNTNELKPFFHTFQMAKKPNKNP